MYLAGWGEAYLPDSHRDMNKRVGPVENSQHGLVVSPEPHLDIDLSQREEEAERALVLEPKNSNAVVLGRLPNTIGGEDQFAGLLDADVEEQVDGPVEHLDQEGELLDEAAVPVVGEARGIGRRDDGAAAAALLGRTGCVCGRAQEGRGSIMIVVEGFV